MHFKTLALFYLFICFNTELPKANWRQNVTGQQAIAHRPAQLTCLSSSTGFVKSRGSEGGRNNSRQQPQLLNPALSSTRFTQNCEEPHTLCMVMKEQVCAEQAEGSSGGLYLCCRRVPQASDAREVGKELLFILPGNDSSQNGLKHQHNRTKATLGTWHNQTEGCACCTLIGR